MKIEKDDFVECTASLDSFHQLLQEKMFQSLTQKMKAKVLEINL